MDANVNQMKQTRVPRIRRGVEILGMSYSVGGVDFSWGMKQRIK